MAQDTLPGADHLPPPELPSMRCADSARMRGESLPGSAVTHRRFLFLEVPGAWGRSALDEKLMGPQVARQLAASAKASGTHVLLIRRPGRHPSSESGTQKRAMAWAVADVSPGSERILWGVWRDAADLLSLDMDADIPGAANAAGPQRLALVCTNGKRDQCCAIRGRPVAAALTAAGDWDTWECSHLGGHRFAATMMLLPTGDMFGWLDPESALEVVRHFDAGRLMLSHYRGRAGQPLPVQAALHSAAVRLGDYRRAALRASSACRLPTDTGWVGHTADGPDLWEVVVIHQTEHSPGAAYRLVLAESRVAPSFLSCSDAGPKAETRFETLSFSRI
jgi:hypothetical protein